MTSAAVGAVFESAAVYTLERAAVQGS